MRCYICDWSPVGEQSLFHGGLSTTPDKRGQRLTLDAQGRHICTHCEQDSTLTEADYPSPGTEAQPIEEEVYEYAD